MAQSDGHDAPGLIDELVPRHTAVVDEIVVRFEDAVRQPIVTQELRTLTGLSSGHFGGSAIMVMFGGTDKSRRQCQPA